MISVLNYKPFNRSGTIRGFFDLRYHGLTIKGCKLMNGNNGLWFSFPQVKGEQDGETKYFDQMFLTTPEREHVRTLISAQLRAEGHVNHNSRRAPDSGNLKVRISQSTIHRGMTIFHFKIWAI